jgi:hypothetical protein
LYDDLGGGACSVRSAPSLRGDVEVPGTHGRRRVVAVSESGFRNRAATGVSLPEGVARIGARAFEGCRLLARASLPGSLFQIREATFDGCARLEGIAVPEGVSRIGAAAFRGCRALESASLPESLSSIGYRAFDGCARLESVFVPIGVSRIDACAFMGCPSLRIVAAAPDPSAHPSSPAAGWDPEWSFGCGGVEWGADS